MRKKAVNIQITQNIFALIECICMSLFIKVAILDRLGHMMRLVKLTITKRNIAATGCNFGNILRNIAFPVIVMNLRSHFKASIMAHVNDRDLVSINFGCGKAFQPWPYMHL